MSLLDKAKKQAKRLFDISKNSQSSLKINNLSHSREIIAVINGFKNWYDYALYLDKKSYIFDSEKINDEKINKNKQETNPDYFMQKIPLRFIKKDKSNRQILDLVSKNWSAIKLGKSKSKENDVLLRFFPLYVQGGTGSALNFNLTNIAEKYISEKEGVIFIDSKSQPNTFERILNSNEGKLRKSDIYRISFTQKNMSEATNVLKIDPINPMIGNENYFKTMLGETIYPVIYAILTMLEKEDYLFGAEQIKSLLMLPSLIDLISENNTFLDSETKEVVSLYLKSIDLNDVNVIKKESVDKHANNSIKAKKFVDFMEKYSELFEIQQHSKFELMFAQRKIIYIDFFEDSLCEYNDIRNEFVNHLIFSTENKIRQIYKGHVQNIIFNQCHFIKKEKDHRAMEESNNHYIIAFDSEKRELLTRDYIKNMIHLSKSQLILKNQNDLLPEKIRYDMSCLLKEIPPLMFCCFNNIEYNEWKPLFELKENEGFYFEKGEEYKVIPLYLN